MYDAGHDVEGNLCTLTVITPIELGREQALRDELTALGDSDNSPMASVPRTHLARFMLVHDLPKAVLRRNHLLFNAAYDRPWHDYLPALHDKLGELVPRIWGKCEGYPASADATAFTAWMLTHRVEARVVLPAYPDADLETVRTALERRHQIADFARRYQNRAAETVREAYEDRFGRL